ncbi:MAG: polysaccharide deacetylase family protein [Gemmatimonadaceae bacterium]
MPKMYRPIAFALATIAATASLACSKGEASPRATSSAAPSATSSTTVAAHTPERTETANSPAASGSPSRAPNKLGRIPVLEYHLIGDRDAQYSRTREHFRADLEDAYRLGYRPITLSQMLDKDFRDVPAGMSPVVVVFDDASPEQFRYIDRSGQLQIDPTSGLGIWLDFAKSHPGWKNRAVFCMLNGGAAGHNFFGDNPKFAGQQKAWRFQKVKYLADNGFELCDHTLWHAMLNKYSDAVVQEQIARNAMGIDSAVPGYKIRSMALPYGIWPKNKSLAWHGSWTDPKTGKTHSYNFDAVMEVSGGPTRSPYDPQFDPHHVTRIEAIGNDIAQTLDKLDKTNTRFVVGK